MVNVFQTPTLAATLPEAVCKGLLEGLVYETVTELP